MNDIRKILCPIAGTEESGFVSKAAATLARKFGAKLTLLNVIPHNIVDFLRPFGSLVSEDILPEKIEAQLEQQSQEILEAAKKRVGDDLEVETLTVIGHPGDVICYTADKGDYDLIVIGNKTTGPVKRVILGSVSDYVVHHSERAVLIARCGEPG